MNQIGPDIRRLSEVLASPKARGNFGEEMLEGMLEQVLPKSSYQAQYKFKNGEVVDIIVRVGEKILPIDSKFSMENFRLYKEAKEDEAAENLKKAFLKDIKKRVDEIHKKYILPQEGTFDFALMYIPSEGVFSEALEDVTTITYAREKKVYFVSPNTLYHHLQIVLLSLRGQQINQTAERILAMIGGIKQESDKFGRNLEVLGNHIKNAGNTMGTVSNDFVKLKASIGNAATLQLEEAEETNAQIIETQKLID
jgi:DNA recombination protein RmuC